LKKLVIEVNESDEDNNDPKEKEIPSKINRKRPKVAVSSSSIAPNPKANS